MKKMENVTQREDPEFFALMSKTTRLWLDYHSARFDAEQDPTRKNLDRENRLLKLAEKSQQEQVSLAEKRGYDTTA